MNYITKTFTYGGKRYYIRGKTEAEVLKKLVDKKINLKMFHVELDSNLLVNDWFDKYVETYKRNASKKTISDYYGIYKHAIKPYIGSLPLEKVKQIDCQRILNATADKSTSYSHKVSILLSGMFEKACDNDLIVKSPMKAVIRPVTTQRERRALTAKEREIFLKSADLSGKAGLFCKIIYYCGLRPSEVSRIKGSDYKDGMLSVRGTKTKASNRIVPIPDVLQLPKIKQNQLLFQTANGNPIDKSKYQVYWRHIKREMDIMMGCTMYRNKIIESKFPDDLTLYCLRHDYCTRLQEADVPIDIARRLMGHSSVEITSRIYTHNSDTILAIAKGKINDFYHG